MNRAERRRRGLGVVASAPVRALSIGALISTGLVTGYLGNRPRAAYATVTTCSSVVGDIVTDDSFIAAIAAASAGTCQFIDIGANIDFSGRGLLDDTLTLTADATIAIGSAVDDSTVTLHGNGTPGLLIETTPAYNLTLVVSDVTFTGFDDSTSHHAALSVDVGGDLYATLDTVSFIDNTSTWSGVSGDVQTAALDVFAVGIADVRVIGETTFSGNVTGPDGIAAVHVSNSGGTSHLYLGNGAAAITLDANVASGATVQADYLNLIGVHVVDHSSPGHTIKADRYLYVYDSYFARNQAGVHGGGSGGAIRAAAGGFIGHSTFTNNYSGDVGGAIDATGGHVNVRNSTFADDSALYSGGAIAAQSMDIVDSSFTGNDTTGYYDASVPAVYGSVGGAVFADDTVTVDGSIFADNAASSIYYPGGGDFYGGYGGAIYAGGPVTMSTSTVIDNTAGSSGGGIFARDEVRLTGSTLARNAAGKYDGGAIFALGSGSIVNAANSTFYGNAAPYNGGAIFADDSISLAYVTAVDDSATGNIVAPWHGTLTVTGSVIAPALGAACWIPADDSSIASFVTDSSCGVGDDTVAEVSRTALAFDAPLTSSATPGRQVLVPGYSSVLANAAPNVSGLSVDQLGAARSAPTSSGSVLVPVPPPPPPTPALPPTDVLATPGDQSADVAWSAPSSTGTFAVTNYQVEATPGGGGCLTAATSCRIDGLTNGTAYTFRVRALTGAGWSAWSTPSAPVTPGRPQPRVTIAITGMRDGRLAIVEGRATGLTGRGVQAMVKPAGQSSYARGATRTVSDTGTFTWERRSGKKVYVYFIAEDGTVRSNRVVIPAR